MTNHYIVSEEVLQMCLYRLEDVFGKNTADVPTINELRTLLAKGPVEPVAWFCGDESTLSFAAMRGCDSVPLYAIPKD